ncbi:MAG TPA: serine hydrolase domain-containing protein [Ktedonobacteraceae bacterium]|nr:serine hydrolase domain-containing protein [Ktedonobacteraceae bacterium]
MKEKQGISSLAPNTQRAFYDIWVESRVRKNRRKFQIATLLMVIASMLVIFAFVLTAWNLTTSAAPLDRTPVPAAQVATRVQKPTLTPTQQATPSPQISPQIASQIDSLLENKASQQQFSGSVLIAINGQVLLSKGYSMADWNKNIPNTAQTRFYLGSVTKQFTAMGILILQEQGKLNVHDPLCKYIQPCPPPWQPLTIHELLTHTSGIPQLDDSQLSGSSPQAWMNSYDNVPLEFTPGTQFDYCSVCFQILGYVIQQASGKPYSEFIEESILDPLQMKHTGFGSDYYYSLTNHATGYASWQVPAMQLGWDVDPQWSFLFGSGLMQSTVGDLYIWDQALYTQTLVSRQTLNEAFTEYDATSEFAGSGYGYGWFIAKSPVRGHRLIWHDGRIDGFRTYIGRYVDDHVTIIFLSNLASLDELALAQQIQQIVFANYHK